jgi:polysaccharide biosynthesis transport protein
MTNNINNTSNIKTNTLRDYINLFKANSTLIIIIVSIIFAGTAIYAVIAPNIYTSTVTLKITPPQGNILNSGFGDFGNFGSQGPDRFIANEIETIYNSTIIEKVASSVIDTFKAKGNKNDFSLILNNDYFKSDKASLKSLGKVISELTKNVLITQKNGLDFIDINVNSPSPYESALIANTFAKTYRDFNLLENRKQISTVKEFLGEQLKEKQQELYSAEDAIKAYQLKKGGVELDQQSKLLVSRLADFEAQKNTAKIDMSISKEKLNQYKIELEKKDPSISSFLANKTSEPYLQKLQEQIANLETQRDVALASSKTARANDSIIEEYNSKIQALKEKLDRSMAEYRSMILSSSPEDIKDLSQKMFAEEVQYQSLIASANSISNVINSYEGQFNQLPSSTLELARLERQRQAAENLYNTLNTKYQETQLNEQATPGNVLIMNTAYEPDSPSEPNRIKIIIMGLFAGIGFALGFVYVRNYFDKTIKSPEDIASKNINVLAWVPKIKYLSGKNKDSELIVAKHPDSIQSEAFKTLRTRLQFSAGVKDLKVILVTSSAPGEGKSVVSSNLATSFAQDHKKTVIVDCDLRKPRIHLIFNDEDSPGFLNYFFGKSSYESIIRKTEVRNLDYITGGSIPPNPSEIIGSPRMKAFILKLRSEYDIIILDSPPIMAVSDSEILSRLTDGNILVASSDSTEIDWLEESVELLTHEKSKFLGVLLNKFNYKSGYHAYYKYYGHYAKQDQIEKKIKIKNKI